MATETQIQEWKHQYGNIFGADYRGGDLIFRPLTASEYDQVLESEAKDGTTRAEELALEFAILEPEDIGSLLDGMPAGYVSSLCDSVVSNSGWGNPKYAKNKLNQLREESQDVRFMMKAFVLSVMTGYTEEQLDDLTFDQLAAKVVLAEQVISIQQQSIGVDIPLLLEPVDPEEEAMKQEQEKQKHAARNKPGQAGYDDPIARKLQQALG